MYWGKNRSTIARKFSAQTLEQESRELKKLISQHPEINYVLKILSDWWHYSEHIDEKETEQAFERLLQKIKNES